jgi:tRNA(Ile)-lysidine synthase
MQDDFYDRFRGFIAQQGLLPDDVPIVTAVSGGQDSCAILHLFVRLRDERQFPLYAAHLHHGFRGADADADAAFVRAFAESLGVPCFLEKQDVPERARRLHRSAQEAARQARFTFLERIAASVTPTNTPPARIALGHTADDHAETVLLNLLRGTGTEGLRGMRPQNDMPHPRIRPLLAFSRADTEEYCRRHAIPFRVDASNTSRHYTRSRLRHDLLPHLADTYNPNIRQALLRLSEIAGDESDYLEAIAQQHLTALCVHRSAERMAITRDGLRGLPRAMQRRVLRLALLQFRGELTDVTFRAIERFLQGLALPETALLSETLPHSAGTDTLRLHLDPQTLSIQRTAPEHQPRDLCTPLQIPGITNLPEWNLQIEGTLLSRDALPTTLTTLAETSGNKVTAQYVWMSAEALHFPLTLRNRRTGDRFQPFGMAGSRKVQDILTDHKVPRAERGTVPILTDSVGIVWVVGHIASERTRILPTTERILALVLRYLQ